MHSSNKYLNFKPNKQINKSLNMHLFSRAFDEIGDLGLSNIFNYIATKIKYGAPAIILIAGFFIFVLSYTIFARKRKDKVGRVISRSMSFGALHGGKVALERLVDYHKARAEATEDVTELSKAEAEAELKGLLAKELVDFSKMQYLVEKLEISEKESAAVKLLEKALVVALKEGKVHEAYEIEMFLVEMLIYKGDFKKANGGCLKDENHETISDSRRLLYKAIIHVLLGHDKDAEKYWNEYKDMQSNFQWPPDMQSIINIIQKQPDDKVEYKAITNFDEFKRVVKLLKPNISDAKKKE